MTATDQLRRLLAILPELSDGGEHPIAELAARLNVSPATILGDLHAMSERWGDPAGWVEKVHLYVEAEHVSMEATRHFRRPMRLSADECRAIELGLVMLSREVPPDERSTIETPLRKVRELMTNQAAEAEETLVASAGAETNAAAIARLRASMRNRTKVRITYQKSAAEATDQRMVCPFSFAVEKGVWYLVAHCDRSEAVRIFRLDRIVDLGVTYETFGRGKDYRIEELLQDGRAFVGPAVETMRVRYSPKVARWVAEREHGAQLPDGSLEVEHPVADREWAARHVLQYGAEAVVIEPEDLRLDVLSRLRRAAG